MPKTFHRTPGRHCCCSDSVNSEFSVFQFGRQCRFLQRLGVDLTSARWRLAHCSSFLSRAPHALLDGLKCRWRRASPTPAASAVAEPPVAASESQRQLSAPSSTAQSTRGLRVAVYLPAHAAALSPWPGEHRARSLPLTGPRGAVPSKPRRKQNPTELTVRLKPVDHHVDTQPPKPPVRPLQHRNRCRSFPIRGNRLGPAINSLPELAFDQHYSLHLTRAPPRHQ